MKLGRQWSYHEEGRGDVRLFRNIICVCFLRPFFFQGFGCKRIVLTYPLRVLRMFLFFGNLKDLSSLLLIADTPYVRAALTTPFRLPFYFEFFLQNLFSFVVVIIEPYTRSQASFLFTPCFPRSQYRLKSVQEKRIDFFFFSFSSSLCSCYESHSH